MNNKQIKNLKEILKSFEGIVKGTDQHGRPFLINGSNIGRSDIIPIEGGDFFEMRPREARANRLLCAVLQHLHKHEIVFQEDDGDGTILDKTTKHRIKTEHVSTMDYFDKNKLPKGEIRIINAINIKIKKGPKYAEGKTLIVFFDGLGERYRDKVRENIQGRHNFSGVYCIGLLSTDNNGYGYSVTEFHKNYSITFRVQVNLEFTDREVTQII